jgi:hypothetical protein
LKTQKTVGTWNPSCGKDGPHGLGVDMNTSHLFVACSTLAEVLDVGREGGGILSMVDTGDGVDDLHYVPATHLLYVGAARAAKLTIARADDSGHLTVVATVPVQEGARNGVIAKNGTIILAHSGIAKLSALLFVSPNGK